MKGIETLRGGTTLARPLSGSDHCPAMKGIETRVVLNLGQLPLERSDHCPAMKGIETRANDSSWFWSRWAKRPLPRNEGD